ncbi:hypothetical protein ACFWWC_03150 [Streptomyces sp. NPDC058642]|uniref:hypothetical protein n=1 Tax=Streptomyces sp. NPDC058642 TaxID=3346572 RepID=UPI00365B16BE
MVRVFATEAGIAIANARLYQAAKQRERWIDGSVAVTTALLSGAERRAESLGGGSRHRTGIGKDGGGTTVVWEAPLDGGATPEPPFP